MSAAPGPPTEPQAGPDLLESARLLGGYAWAERRLFEVLGSWVPAATDPAATVLLDVQCRHHAWYASVWIDRLPELREVPREQVVVAPAGGFEGFLEAVADAPASDLERVGALVGVVQPHFLDTYRRHLDRLSVVADAPLQRWMGIVISDLQADLDAGREVLRALSTADGDAGRAQDEQARTAAELDRLGAALAATDGLAGAP
jgi:hypothetical protein